ncbi:hypothetical protein PO124_04420 [Bacillus licheniformis]|nr:hypothetical protein [Bacillus licheniformis]
MNGFASKDSVLQCFGNGIRHVVCGEGFDRSRTPDGAGKQSAWNERLDLIEKSWQNSAHV